MKKTLVPVYECQEGVCTGGGVNVSRRVFVRASSAVRGGIKLGCVFVLSLGLVRLLVRISGGVTLFWRCLGRLLPTPIVYTHG